MLSALAERAVATARITAIAAKAAVRPSLRFADRMAPAMKIALQGYIVRIICVGVFGLIEWRNVGPPRLDRSSERREFAREQSDRPAAEVR